MCERNQLQLKLDGDSATLCVHGALDRAGASSMLELCAALPLHIRTLHVDLRSLGAMSGEATGAVRSLLAHWRTTRGGEFRLITSHLLATCSPAPVTSATREPPHTTTCEDARSLSSARHGPSCQTSSRCAARCRAPSAVTVPTPFIG